MGELTPLFASLEGRRRDHLQLRRLTFEGHVRREKKKVGGLAHREVLRPVP